MSPLRRLQPDESGAVMVETAFALPVLIMMIWLLVQLGLIYRANAGMQQALGEGARFATLCVSPTALGCTVPTPEAVQTKMQNTMDGQSAGTMTADTPVLRTASGARYYDLRVTYSQPTSLLLLPGPNISIVKTKRVWVATN